MLGVLPIWVKALHLELVGHISVGHLGHFLGFVHWVKVELRDVLLDLFLALVWVLCLDLLLKKGDLLVAQHVCLLGLHLLKVLQELMLVEALVVIDLYSSHLQGLNINSLSIQVLKLLKSDCLILEGLQQLVFVDVSLIINKLLLVWHLIYLVLQLLKKFLVFWFAQVKLVPLYVLQLL